MAPKKKPESDLKNQRIPIMMTESELTAIDDWSFHNRIRSRGEAIRRLCQIAMEVEQPVTLNAALAVAFSRGADEAFEMLDAALSDPDASVADRKASLEKTRGWFRRSASHILQYSGVLLAIMQAFRLPGDPAVVFRVAKEKAEALKAENSDPRNRAFDEIFSSLFPGLDNDVAHQKDNR